MTVTAIIAPHNDGIEVCYLSEPGDRLPLAFVDLYECDLSGRVFDTRAEAEAWVFTRVSGPADVHAPITEDPEDPFDLGPSA